jgi:uncharacterized protein (DUF2141 family)
MVNMPLLIFQDLNGNKKLDKNFIGIPTEPFAFSQITTNPVFGTKVGGLRV